MVPRDSKSTCFAITFSSQLLLVPVNECQTNRIKLIFYYEKLLFESSTASSHLSIAFFHSLIKWSDSYTCTCVLKFAVGNSKIRYWLYSTCSQSGKTMRITKEKLNPICVCPQRKLRAYRGSGHPACCQRISHSYSFSESK